MKTRLFLLRGINVGGRKKIPMAELRHLADELGLITATTHLQSGNLVAGTDLEEHELLPAMEVAIADRFGFDVQVISRSAEEMKLIAGSHPFTDLGLDDRMLHVAFLGQEPSARAEDMIEASQYAPDRFSSSGREVYLAYPNGSGRSKLNQALLERRLGVTVTARNWRTVTALTEVITERE